jgi:hypothetical protein
MELKSNSLSSDCEVDVVKQNYTPLRTVSIRAGITTQALARQIRLGRFEAVRCGVYGWFLSPGSVRQVLDHYSSRRTILGKLGAQPAA